MLSAEDLLKKELIDRVSALDGKQHEINSNRHSLNATIDALKECTSVDPAVIANIADQLSVKPEYIEANPHDREAQAQIDRNTRYAKTAVKVIVLLFIWSMAKWFVASGKIKQVMHDTSSLQSQITDFRLRTGHYPYSFEQLGITNNPSSHDSIASLDMGAGGQLLVKSTGFMKTEIMLVPSALNNGWSKWQCTTNESYFFVITKWLCQYGSTKFRG